MIGIPIAAIAGFVGTPIIALVYDALLVMAAVMTAKMAPSTANLRFRRQMDPVLSVRTANKITLHIENDGVERIQMRLRDEAPASCIAESQEFSIRLDPGDQIEKSYQITPIERGSDEFRGTWVRLNCPLGLVEKQVKLDTEEPVRIYPNVLALKEFNLLKQQGRLREIGIRRSRMKGLGTDFESLREYSEGDDFRKIDWKATARKGKLVVRQFEQERNQSIILAIDIGRHMLSEVNGVRKLDHVLDSLLMLTNAAALAGDLVGLLVYADTVRRYIPPRKGRSQVGLIIEAIHDLVAEPVESNSITAFAYLGQRWKRRSLLINFTDYDDIDRATDLAKSFGPMARRHLALICRVSDPYINKVFHQEVETTRDMYRRAAASMLLEDRRKAHSIIERAGIHNLEAESQNLAATLVSYYFMVKERSLL